MYAESSNSYGWEPLKIGVGEVDSISSGKVTWLAGESSFYVWNRFSRSSSHCYLSLPECRRCSNFMVIRVRISTQSNCSTVLLWLLWLWWLLLLLLLLFPCQKMHAQVYKPNLRRVSQRWRWRTRHAFSLVAECCASGITVLWPNWWRL